MRASARSERRRVRHVLHMREKDEDALPFEKEKTRKREALARRALCKLPRIVIERTDMTASSSMLTSTGSSTGSSIGHVTGNVTGRSRCVTPSLGDDCMKKGFIRDLGNDAEMSHISVAVSKSTRYRSRQLASGGWSGGGSMASGMGSYASSALNEDATAAEGGIPMSPIKSSKLGGRKTVAGAPSEPHYTEKVPVPGTAFGQSMNASMNNLWSRVHVRNGDIGRRRSNMIIANVAETAAAHVAAKEKEARQRGGGRGGRGGRGGGGGLSGGLSDGRGGGHRQSIRTGRPLAHPEAPPNMPVDGKKPNSLYTPSTFHPSIPTN